MNATDESMKMLAPMLGAIANNDRPKASMEDVSDISLSVEHDTPLISIAISLKRIADALNDPDPVHNPITRAITNGINEGAMDWIGHMARNGR